MRAILSALGLAVRLGWWRFVLWRADHSSPCYLHALFEVRRLKLLLEDRIKGDW